MAAGNQVTLTFAGDTSKLDKAFASVGATAATMSTKVAAASTSMNTKLEESTSRMSKLSETTDETAGKASRTYGAIGALGSGLTLMGLQSGEAGKVLGYVGLAFDALSGIMDLTSLATARNTAETEANTVATEGNRIASLASAAASKVAAAADWVLNAALAASPVILITVAIIALVAIIVVIATKTTWFQTIWKKSWGGVKDAAVDVWDWLKALPGNISSVFGKIANIIAAPFKAGFNGIADAWNNTAGRFSIHIPGWVPGIGGDGFSMPQIPKFHSGGTVPGAPGSEMLAILQAGERITPVAGGSGGNAVAVYGGDAVTAAVIASIRQDIGSRYGGNVVVYLAGDR